MSASGPLLPPDLGDWLAHRLTLALPGRAAHLPMAPELSYWRQHDRPPATARQAAVLVLLYPYPIEWHVLLTLRPEHLTHHPGQISFPGGAVEQGENSSQAALRELEEELGVAPTEIRMRGRLSEIYAFASDHHVTPWVATATQRPSFHPNPQEVTELIEVPLASLLDPATIGRHEQQRGQLRFTAPHFLAGAHRIWGVTGMILAELAALVAEAAEA